VKVEKTDRGFAIIEFKDRYDNPCSLQKSSLATDEAIWLGVDDIKPQILEEGQWVRFPLPANVVFHNRMHLTRDQVSELIPHLQKFVETGEI
jgi:hypothetical protein